jgi:hypothetical protein
MPFSTPRNAATSYLILRHLYEGDVIEWPIAEDHPKKPLLDALEAQGLIARWDRMWPLHDRYRLTDKGIAAIEAIYRPAGAEAFLADVRKRSLPPAERRAFVTSRGLDPVIWPILHDPYTHWSNLDQDQGQYHAFLWEDQRPPLRKPRPPKVKPAPAPKPRPPARVGGGGGVRVVHHMVTHDVHHHHHHPHQVVDLDGQVEDPGDVDPVAGDYDVS